MAYLCCLLEWALGYLRAGDWVGGGWLKGGGGLRLYLVAIALTCYVGVGVWMMWAQDAFTQGAAGVAAWHLQAGDASWWTAGWAAVDHSCE